MEQQPVNTQIQYPLDLWDSNVFYLMEPQPNRIESTNIKPEDRIYVGSFSNHFLIKRYIWCLKQFSETDFEVYCFDYNTNGNCINYRPKFKLLLDYASKIDFKQLPESIQNYTTHPNAFLDYMTVKQRENAS